MDKRAKDFGNVKSISKIEPLLSVGFGKVELNGEIEGECGKSVVVAASDRWDVEKAGEAPAEGAVE